MTVTGAPCEDAVLNHYMRKSLGCFVGNMFVLSGKRAQKLKYYEKTGRMLSIYSHNPRLTVLSDIIRWLKRYDFVFLSTDDILKRESTELVKTRRVVWLTFDDGWADNSENVFPVLLKENIPATFFIAPGETLRGSIWTTGLRNQYSAEELQRLYGLPDEDRYRFLDQNPRMKETKRTLLTREMIKAYASNPLFTFENHTYSHLSATHLPADYVKESVLKAQSALAQWTNRAPKLVCYPFGHWNESTDEMIHSLGLIPVHSTPGVQMASDELGTYRNLFYNDMSFAENSCRILGAWTRIKAM